AVADAGYRAAAKRLGRDVADAEPARGAGEPSVGNQRDRFAQARADDRAGDREHLAHARPAARSLVPDDDDVTGLDRLGLDGLERGFFAVEDTRGAAMLHAIGARDLHDGAIGRA